MVLLFCNWRHSEPSQDPLDYQSVYLCTMKKKNNRHFALKFALSHQYFPSPSCWDCKMNSCTEHLFFSFPSDFFIYQLDFSVFSIAFHFAFHSISEFLFSVLFWILWMLVTVNKATFSLWKKLITLSKFLIMGWAVWKIGFTSWKTFITSTYSLMRA